MNLLCRGRFLISGEHLDLLSAEIRARLTEEEVALFQLVILDFLSVCFLWRKTVESGCATRSVNSFAYHSLDVKYVLV